MIITQANIVIVKANRLISIISVLIILTLCVVGIRLALRHMLANDASVTAIQMAYFAAKAHRVPYSTAEFATWRKGNGEAPIDLNWISRAKIKVEWGMPESDLTNGKMIFSAEDGPLKDMIPAINFQFYNFYRALENEHRNAPPN